MMFINHIFALFFGILIGIAIKHFPGRVNDEYKLDQIKRNSFQEGKTEGLKLGFENGKKQGEDFMKTRYITFMEEILTMVKNDEMEIIEFIGDE